MVDIMNLKVSRNTSIINCYDDRHGSNGDMEQLKKRMILMMSEASQLYAPFHSQSIALKDYLQRRVMEETEFSSLQSAFFEWRIRVNDVIGDILKRRCSALEDRQQIYHHIRMINNEKLDQHFMLRLVEQLQFEMFTVWRDETKRAQKERLLDGKQSQFSEYIYNILHQAGIIPKMEMDDQVADVENILIEKTRILTEEHTSMLVTTRQLAEQCTAFAHYLQLRGLKSAVVDLAQCILSEWFKIARENKQKRSIRARNIKNVELMCNREDRRELQEVFLRWYAVAQNSRRIVLAHISGILEAQLQADNLLLEEIMQEGDAPMQELIAAREPIQLELSKLAASLEKIGVSRISSTAEKGNTNDIVQTPPSEISTKVLPQRFVENVLAKRIPQAHDGRKEVESRALSSTAPVHTSPEIQAAAALRGAVEAASTKGEQFITRSLKSSAQGYRLVIEEFTPKVQEVLPDHISTEHETERISSVEDSQKTQPVNYGTRPVSSIKNKNEDWRDHSLIHSGTSHPSQPSKVIERGIRKSRDDEWNEHSGSSHPSQLSQYIPRSQRSIRSQPAKIERKFGLLEPSKANGWREIQCKQSEKSVPSKESANKLDQDSLMKTQEIELSTPISMHSPENSLEPLETDDDDYCIIQDDNIGYHTDITQESEYLIEETSNDYPTGRSMKTSWASIQEKLQHAGLEMHNDISDDPMNEFRNSNGHVKIHNSQEAHALLHSLLPHLSQKSEVDQEMNLRLGSRSGSDEST